MKLQLSEIIAFFKNLQTQEFTGPFGPDWTIRKIAFAQGCIYARKLAEHNERQET